MRSIDVDFVCDHIEKEIKDIVIPRCPYAKRKDSEYDIGYNNGLTMAKAIAMKAPTVDAEPVRCDVCEIMEKGHGRIRLYHGNGRQVAIGRGVDGYELVISHFGEHFATKIDYCPYCGAKIDGGAKE